MKRLAAGAFASTLLLSLSASAFDDGNDLLESLDSDSPTLRFGSIMYIAGVYEGSKKLWSFADRDLFCPNENLTREDIADAVRIWLRGRTQETRSDSASLSVIFALTARFPCD